MRSITALPAASDVAAPLMARSSRGHALRTLIASLVIGHCSLITSVQLRAAQLDLTTATIADLQSAMSAGALTSEKLVELYLARIDAYDKAGPKINAIITLKDRATALAEARALDAERKAGKIRGPLHGVVVVAKDVFDTYDLPTTGGYVPLKGVKPTKDSFIIKKLRESGCVILAKLNQSDWYGQPPNTASSTLGGSSLNPYDLKRTPGWSSSGTGGAMAAVFGTIGLGSETGSRYVRPRPTAISTASPPLPASSPATDRCGPTSPANAAAP